APVAEVDLAVRDVPVATDDVLAPLAPQRAQIREEALHELELDPLALLARRTRLHVERDHRQLAETRLDPAPFRVDVGPTESRDHFVGLDARIERDAAVTRLFRVVVEVVPALGMEDGVLELVALRFRFLEADDRRILRAHPVEEALAGRRPYAVQVRRDDPHWRVS